jgi:predicted enzyme related to lactoylglutathione lyase
MTELSRNILNRVEINIKENDSNEIYKFYQDWLKLTQMKHEINIKPNVIEFDFLPGYKFYGLKLKDNDGEVNNNPLTINFVCDFWEKEI